MDFVSLLNAVFPIAVSLLIGLGLWRLILWNSYAPIGWQPLTLAYALSTTVLLVATAVLGVIDSNARPFDFTFFLVVLALMPLLVFTGVPIVSLLVRIDRLN
jgi:hypothetical protein